MYSECYVWIIGQYSYCCEFSAVKPYWMVLDDVKFCHFILLLFAVWHRSCTFFPTASLKAAWPTQTPIPTECAGGCMLFFFKDQQMHLWVWMYFYYIVHTDLYRSHVYPSAGWWEQGCSCFSSIVLTTLKMASWVAETFLCVLCNKITFVHSSAFIGIFEKGLYSWLIHGTCNM